jgi:hypothetical protein
MSDPAVTGKEVLEEDLREICVYQLNGQQTYFKYVKYAHVHCYETINEDCSRKAHEHLSIDYAKTNKCVNDSDQGATNTLLEEERDYAALYGSTHWPAVVINNRTYRGDLEPEGLFFAICAGFKNKPEVCKKHDSTSSLTDGSLKSDKWVWIIMGIIAVVGIEMLLLWCYRKFSRKEIEGQMKMEVNSAVS